MGNNTSMITEKKPFGSIYKSEHGKTRPGYYIKGNKVIYKGKQINVLENETDFQKLKFGYLKSNKRVFYSGESIHTANPLTFTVLTRNNVHTLSKSPEKNEEFGKLNSVLGMDFLGNKKRIFYKNRIIHDE
jgi:hypothetical protein